MVASITNILKQTRSDILSCLKARGRMQVDDLASSIGMSKVSIRRHLELLSRDGLVSFDVEHHERGRPAHVYFLTEKAELLFPNSYSSFALSLIQKTASVFGQNAATEVIHRHVEDQAESLKPALEGLTFDRRVRRLSVLIDERGYGVSVRRLRDGSYLWKQRNCPLIAVASACCQLCDEELHAYKGLLETEVVRDSRIAAGARSCDFRILNPETAKDQGGERFGRGELRKVKSKFRTAEPDEVREKHSAS